MNNSRGMAIAFAAVMVCCSTGHVYAAGEGNGGLYEWKDDRGVVNVTDDLGKIPDKYRSRAKKLGQAGASQGSQEPTSPKVSPAPEAVPRPAEQSDEDRKAQWQRRMRTAQQQLAAAEDRYRQLNQRKSDIASQWGSSGAALPPQDALDQIAQIDRDLERAKSDINDAKNMVEVTIPDEARKAGIPPGWLREVE